MDYTTAAYTDMQGDEEELLDENQSDGIKAFNKRKKRLEQEKENRKNLRRAEQEQRDTRHERFRENEKERERESIPALEEAPRSITGPQIIAQTPQTGNIRQVQVVDVPVNRAEKAIFSHEPNIRDQMEIEKNTGNIRPVNRPDIFKAEKIAVPQTPQYGNIPVSNEGRIGDASVKIEEAEKIATSQSPQYGHIPVSNEGRIGDASVKIEEAEKIVTSQTPQYGNIPVSNEGQIGDASVKIEEAEQGIFSETPGESKP
eukprot:Pgem_evm3s19015